MSEPYQNFPDSSAGDGEYYSRQDAIQILTGSALLLLPKLRANQAAGIVLFAGFMITAVR